MLPIWHRIGVMSINNKLMSNKEHPYWGRLASTTVNYVDYLTHSHDMIVEVLPDTRTEEEKKASSIVPAYFVPSERRIFLDASTAFADETSDISAYDIDVSRKADRNIFPLFTGMLAHEIGHEKYTRYAHATHTNDGSKVTSLEMEIVKILEEPRMEKMLLDDHPDPACYLSSVVHHVILKSLLKKFIVGQFEKSEALTLFLLVKSRLILGIIPDSFLPMALEKRMNELLGEDNLIGLSSVIRLVLPNLNNDDCFENMVAIARKVIETLELEDEHPENPCQTQQGQSSEPQTGEANSSAPDSSEGGRSDSTASDEKEGSGDDKNKSDTSMGLTEEQEKELEESLRQANEGLGDHQEKIRNGEEYAETMEDRSGSDLQDRQEVTEEQKEKHLRQVAWEKNDREQRKPYTRDVPPSYNDRFNAQKLYDAIRRAQFRADQITHTPTDKPRGKLVMHEAMRRTIQRDMGFEITAKPWSQTSISMVDNPPLTVGVAMDVSGSREKFIAPFMRYMWSLNEAILMNKGTVNNVLWSENHVTFEHYRNAVQIPTRAFDGRSQGLPNALRKLVANCNLHRADGVKVVFVVTDSILPNSKEIIQELSMLKALGVKVIWVSTEECYRYIYEDYSHFIYMDDPTKFYEIMSPEIVKALESPLDYR